MNTNDPMIFPSRWRGDELKHYSDRWETCYRLAVMKVAAEESERTGRKVSFATLTMNLSMFSTAENSEIRTRIRKEFEQLKEKRHAQTTSQKDKQAST